MKKPFKRLAQCLALCLLISVAGCGDRPRWHGVNMTGVAWGKDFRLADPDGRERTLGDFRGQLVMLFFGFVQCPDICPTSLLRATEVRRLLGADGARLQVIFITLDPERDSAAILREYTAAFDKDFLGLRGDLAATRRTADEFRVFYQKVPTGSSYTMDHTSLSYIIDSHGRMRLGEPHNLSADQIAQDLRRLIDEENADRNGRS